MPRLSKAEFEALFASSMQQADPEEAPPFDFWPYFDRIPAVDFEGFDCSPGHVTHVYRDSTGRYEHVLLDSDDGDVFMVLVLDRGARQVVGHHLLDLPRLYGLRSDPDQIAGEPG